MSRRDRIEALLRRIERLKASMEETSIDAILDLLTELAELLLEE